MNPSPYRPTAATLTSDYELTEDERRKVAHVLSDVRLLFLDLREPEEDGSERAEMREQEGLRRASEELETLVRGLVPEGF
jgi:hypothetical protein